MVRRRGSGAARWRHGWIPLNAAAVKSKRGGRAGAGRSVVAARKPKPSSALPKPVKPISNPNFSKMTKQDKITAAAIMFGRGSKQHKAALKKFR